MAKNKTPTRPEAPPAREPERKVDLSVLTDAKRAEIREKAYAKVQGRAILEAEEELLRQEMDTLERERHPEIVTEMRDIRVDLALYADQIRLDGKVFYHGELYTVSKAQYDVMQEAMQSSKRHEAEIHGDNGREFYRRERGLAVNMRTGMATQGGVPVRF